MPSNISFIEVDLAAAARSENNDTKTENWYSESSHRDEKWKRENSEKVKGRRISFPALAPHNIAADCTDWASLSRVATPLKDPNQQNKYRDPPNIYIIPNFGFKK